MSPLAIALVLTSAVLHAIRDFCTKRALDTRTFQWWFSVGSAVMFFPAFLYAVVIYETTLFGWFYMIAAAFIVHMFYWTMLGKAYESGDLSHVYPIVRSAPAVVLVIAMLFFEETVSTRGVIGIILVVLGAYIINLKSLTLSELIEPVRAIRTNRTIQYAFLTMLGVAAYSIVDSRGIQYVHPAFYVYGINFFITISYSLYVLRTRSKETIMKEWYHSKGPILFNSFFGILSYGFIVYSYSLAPVSYVVGFRQVSIIIAVLLGGHVLQEKHKEIRLLAGLLIFTGAFLIATT